MDYEKKMTDLDTKIKELKQRKKNLKKKHEVDDLKLKVKSQSEQIAQLTADNAELKAKLSDADMGTVAFDPTPKLEKQKGKIEDQARRIEDQGKQIAQLEHDKQDLQAKLTQANRMSTTAPAVDESELRSLRRQNSEVSRQYNNIKKRHNFALQRILELGKEYGFNGKAVVREVRESNAKNRN